MFRNVLLTTDGSFIAAAAYRLVPEIAHPEGRVTIVTVIPEIADSSVRGTAERHLNAARRALFDAGMCNVVTAVGGGDPGEHIVALAAELRCDAIVMSTHGQGEATQTSYGSVAERVISRVRDAAVVLVRPSREHMDSLVHATDPIRSRAYLESDRAESVLRTRTEALPRAGAALGRLALRH